jgi:hypothetical protein
MKKLVSAAIFAVTMLLVGTQFGHAQATRTWVSGVGDDANPCSRTAPCKTFPGAISKTASGGEINVLDPGGFGGVTITKPISIISETEGGVLVSGTNAIIINITSPVPTINTNVYLSGLDIEGLGTGLSGVRIISGGTVHINKSVIRGFKSAAVGNGNGIAVVPSAVDVRVLVSNTRISNNVTGVLVQPTNGRKATVLLDRVTLDNHTANAVDTFTDGAVVDLSNSVISNNFRGVLAHTNSVVNTYGNNVFHNNERSSSALTPVALQ